VVTPFALVTIACVIVVALWWRKRRDSGLAELKRQLTVALFVVMFVFYTPVTRTAMQLFACQDIGGQMRLTADTAVLCDSAGNDVWRFGVGLPLLLLYVAGLPVTVGMLLWRQREALDSLAVRRSLGFFYTGYRPEYYWYELFVMARKAAFAMILVALSPLGLLWQIGVGSLVVMGALAVSAWLKPFTNRIFNMLDTGSMLLSLMTLTGGAVLLQYDESWVGGDGAGGAGAGGKIAQQCVTVVLTVLNFVFIVGMVGWWLHSYLTMELAPRVQKRVNQLKNKHQMDLTATPKAEPREGNFMESNPIESKESVKGTRVLKRPSLTSPRLPLRMNASRIRRASNATTQQKPARCRPSVDPLSCTSGIQYSNNPIIACKERQAFKRQAALS
jgi:hypothetical protein